MKSRLNTRAHENQLVLRNVSSKFPLVMCLSPWSCHCMMHSAFTCHWGHGLVFHLLLCQKSTTTFSTPVKFYSGSWKGILKISFWGRFHHPEITKHMISLQKSKQTMFSLFFQRMHPDLGFQDYDIHQL